MIEYETLRGGDATTHRTEVLDNSLFCCNCPPEEVGAYQTTGMMVWCAANSSGRTQSEGRQGLADSAVQIRLHTKSITFSTMTCIHCCPTMAGSSERENVPSRMV